MSLVKWWPTQQALPRSAIFTEIVSIAVAVSSALFLAAAEGPGDPLLFSEIPEIFSVNTSLEEKSEKITSQLDGPTPRRRISYAVFSRCFCSSSLPLPTPASLIPSSSRIDLGGVVETIALCSIRLSRKRKNRSGSRGEGERRGEEREGVKKRGKR